jgi:hypothetical protein
MVPNCVNGTRCGKKAASGMTHATALRTIYEPLRRMRSLDMMVIALCDEQVGCWVTHRFI